MNNPESCVQEATVSGSICLNHFLAIAVNMTAKHQHRASNETWSRSIWSLGSVFPSYVIMVGIRKPVGSGACWISRLKGELVVEGMVYKLLAASLSNCFQSSLIASCMGENVGTSFFFNDADVRLASR